ncbi:hypothetical protein J4E83_010233 [Alternaria metachromatica]|uniref:uncharacterized protein n=1 Tax=Alternaria metachromatica TaxID=283354 RepID=UPI0020C2D689|nr:uncharacterized protein J4E83_010233 [Alternaria metachromatica]KAI4606212.1 hypothetical protein J4E83_010233 [Alternaria metachromatica]
MEDASFSATRQQAHAYPPGDEVSSVVKDSPNKLSIVNIPTYIEEEQIRELVGSWDTSFSATRQQAHPHSACWHDLVVKDSPNKLSIVNIPTYIEEEQIRELVETQQADLSSLFSFLDLETGSKVHEFADQSSS